jgi:peptidoglycan hydrolase-like protein with peptidoglycan-binding domain
MRWLPALGAAVLLLIVALTASPGTDDTVVGDVATTSTTAPATTTTLALVDPPAPTEPISRNLERGIAGDDVAMVQQRLNDLGFDPGPIDGIYGGVTIQSVWAYEKLVLGTPREQATGVVTPALWERMREPLSVLPRRPTGGLRNHTEIYLPEQVMVVFHADVPTLITHISSGELDEFGQPAVYCEEVTYDTDNNGDLLEEPITDFVCAYAKTPGGVFRYEREITGIRSGPLGDMWDPVYFNYGIAVHGALNVPLEPASHGCVRIPMHISAYFQDLVELGEAVLVWNGVSEPEEVTYEESLPSWWAEVPPEYTTTTSTTTTTTSTTTTTVPATTSTSTPAATSTSVAATTSQG